jgi:predicted transcriptional regulator
LFNVVLPPEESEVMRTVSLKLPESLDERLAAIAAKRGASKSAVVREALEAYVQNDKSIRPGSCLTLAGELVGCVVGPTDLSFHKKHMKGFGK